MPISRQTVEKLRKLIALVSCPSCGKRSEQMESLTSCGHYLCADCVNTFVLNSDNKCPKCYTINRRNDCRENVFLNSVVKSVHKLDKLLNKESSDLSDSEPKADHLVVTKDESKKQKSLKERVIQSLNSCIEKETKSKPQNISSITSSVSDNKDKEKKTKMADNKKSKPSEDEEDIISIPESFGSQFTQNSKVMENTESDMVSMILEGLESNIDDSVPLNTEENGSGDRSKAINDSNVEKKSDFTDIGIQTIEKPRIVLQNVSVQCTVTQSSNCAQTDKMATPTHTSAQSDACNSNNCCFHKFVETISCNSLKTFLKSLIELKDKSSEVEQKLTNNESIQTSNKISIIDKNVESKAEEQSKLDEPISSIDLIQTNSSVDSIPPVPTSEVRIPLEAKTEDVKKPSKPNVRRKSTSNKTTVKRQTSTLKKNKSKKLKSFESSDEEMEVDIKMPKPKAVAPKDVIEIDSSATTTQSSSTVETTSSKSKPRIKGPKSRQTDGQTIAVKTNIEKVSEEPKTKPKAQKTYISSDEEVSDVSETEEFQMNANKSNIKKTQSKTQNKKTIVKPLTDDSTADELTLEKKNKPQKQTVKRSTSGGPKKPSKKFKTVEQLAQVLAEKTNTESVFQFTDEEKKELTDSKQRSKRKSVPKKWFPIEEPKNDEKESEVKALEEKTTNSKKRQQIEDKPKDCKNVDKSSKYKPKPKSKQKQVSESSDDVFKRPESPTPSVALSEASTSSSSSRHRSSSVERSKRVILFSGLDDKQRKKIENVCRELNAEVVNDFSERVTHLVITLAEDRPKKDLICPRNAKYIKALLNNIWIVGYDWIVDSSRSDRFVDESAYEIKADKSATDRGLPNISRTSGQKLFANRMVKFEGKFGSLLSEFTDFVEIGGGIVIQSEEEFDKKKTKMGAQKLIVVTEAVGLPNTQKDGTKYISKKAFMEAISNFNSI